jgi:hypothetical protein
MFAPPAFLWIRPAIPHMVASPNIYFLEYL